MIEKLNREITVLTKSSVINQSDIAELSRKVSGIVYDNGKKTKRIEELEKIVEELSCKFDEFCDNIEDEDNSSITEPDE